MKAEYEEATFWFCTHCGNTKNDINGKMLKSRCECGWYMCYRLLLKGEIK